MRVLKTFLLFSCLWLVLAEGSLEDWYVGLVTVLGATWASLTLGPKQPLSWSLVGAIKFFPYFLLESVRGGWDVAKRVFHPRLPVDPGLMDYHFRLQGEFPRVFTCWVISLFPGTACVGYSKDKATLHVLDLTLPNAQRLADLERRVGAIFGESIGDPPPET